MLDLGPYYEFTSEAVSEGHSDKICDQIADLILDLCLLENPHARVACELLAACNVLVVAGEIAQVDFRRKNFTDHIRQKLRDLWCYHHNFHWENVEIQCFLNDQSQELQEGIYKKESIIGAGDQGIMFGYACDETPELMPAAHMYAHAIISNLTKHRRQFGENSILLPDAKSQVSICYKKDNNSYSPLYITNILVSHQHKPDVPTKQLIEEIQTQILASVPQYMITKDTNIYINPKGSFTLGGPVCDTGLTGRKLMVDTYGGAAPHGGGAFSGKDATKMDRTGAYMARYLAKNIVAAKLARRCTVQISYGISLSKPLSLYINFHNTGTIHPADVAEIIKKNVDLSPEGIINKFQLLNPIYSPTASGGHFGRSSPDTRLFPWERTDLLPLLTSF